MPVSTVCYYPNFVFVRRYSVPRVSPVGSYDIYQTKYEFATKSLTTQLLYAPTIPGENYLIDNNTIIDVLFQSGGNVAIFYIAIESGVPVVKHTTYNNRLLLTAKVIVGSPITEFTIRMFNKNSLEEEIVSSPTTFACFNDYVLPSATLRTQCIGYDQRTYSWDHDTETIIESTSINSASCGYVEPLPDTPVTEIKRIKVITDCVKNPVMLVWKNTKGGWDRWLFGQVQTISRNTESYGRVEQPFFDLSTLESIEKDMGKQQTNFMTVGAQNLTRDEKNGIEKVMVAPVVYKLTKSGNTFTKQYVKVMANKWVSEETDSGSFSVEFDIELPETFSIQ